MFAAANNNYHILSNSALEANIYLNAATLATKKNLIVSFRLLRSSLVCPSLRANMLAAVKARSSRALGRMYDQTRLGAFLRFLSWNEPLAWAGGICFLGNVLGSRGLCPLLGLDRMKRNNLSRKG